MTISVRFNDEDTNFIKKYAELNKISLSDLFRESVLNRIEDEYDLKSYEKAIEMYRKNPITYSHADVVRMMELDDEV